MGTVHLSEGQGIIYTPYWGWYTPIDVNTHTQTVLPHWGVCTVLQWCSRTQRRILGISLLGDPNILSVLVCLTSVRIIMRILITVFYCC